jgi:hypothetical protein
LDDYQFLVFLFGSSQLLHSHTLSPKSIHDNSVLLTYENKYMYIGAIKFIDEVKTGASFAEHSPLLNDISELASWSKVNEGLAKMYKNEVLGKLPIMQHMLFGSLFQSTWTPSRSPVAPEFAIITSAMLSTLSASSQTGGGAGTGGRLEAAYERMAQEFPEDRPAQAVAPWVTSPRSPVSARTPMGSALPSPGARTPSPAPGVEIPRYDHTLPQPSTVTSFLQAFGEIPHVSPKAAEPHRVRSTSTGQSSGQSPLTQRSAEN